ncbi:MAG: hypothetical protein MUQ56_08790 [Thermoleophilia bacterium]|nr:hypothetical protein [Thermoleophilia bacterium]
MIDEEPMTEKEVQELSDALEEANDIAYKLEYLTSQKMPCPKCGGSGSMGAGSLGNIPCLGCNGARYVDHPSMHGAEPHPAVAKIRGWTQTFRNYTYLLDEYTEGDSPRPPSKEGLPTVDEVKRTTKRAAKSAPSTSLPPTHTDQLASSRQRRALAAAEDDEGYENEEDMYDGDY